MGKCEHNANDDQLTLTCPAHVRLAARWLAGDWRQEARRNIARIELTLEGWGAAVPTHPDDTK